MKNISDIRIVFIGTPDFAVASLKALFDAGLNIVGVITVPDKPAGRGLHLQTSPVKDFAEKYNIPVLQPEKLKSPEFINQLKSFRAELQVVVAFRMLPEAVWNMPPLGTINVHASLLPQYRGAAPINWAIINGETETGVTTFKLQHVIDTGNILLQEKIEILPEDNAGTLHDKLMQQGAKLLVKTVEGIVQENLTEVPQSEIDLVDLKPAPKIFKQHVQVNWEKDVNQIHNHIRGLSPYPAALTFMGDKIVKLFKSHPVAEYHNVETGKYEIIPSHSEPGKKELRFAAADGWVYIQELQLEGKKRMNTDSFLRGYRE